MRWDPRLVESEKLAVHAALLSTGQILMFSGDEHDPGRHFLGKTDASYIDSTRLFDGATGRVSAVGSPQVPPGALAPDLFCCGHAFLRDGRLLVAGGTESWTRGQPGDPDPAGHHAMGHFTGLRYAWAFEPESAPGVNPWKRVADMLPQRGRAVGGGRWYPTLLTLATGECLALSGHPSTTHAGGEHNNRMVEVYEASPAPLGSWRDRGDLPDGLDVSLYPRLHLLRNGEVFCVSPMDGRCWAWQSAVAAGSAWRNVAAAPADIEYHGFATTSVLLPLLPHQGYEPRVLLCGGSEPLVISPLALGAGWSPTAGPRQPIRGSSTRQRRHLNAVILPTMDVMVCGGFDAAGAVREVELYHPADDSWTTLPAEATAGVARNYHSVALLMRDGRVFTAGGNDRGDWSYHNSAEYENQTPPRPLPTTAGDPGVDNRETKIEIFEPSYHGRPDRPRITASPPGVRYGRSFTIATPDADRIGRVALIRAGSATHAFNADQRYVGLAFTRRAGALDALAPPDGNVAPPGVYLLFIVAQSGAEAIPSEGAFITVGVAPRKRFKELKPELKELKPELKEHKELKLEVEELKRIPDFVDPKLIREGGDPFHDFVVDPSPLIRTLAERLDELEGRVGEGRAFIRAEERPQLEPDLADEEADALLAAREAAEAAARAAGLEEHKYRPAPAEAFERGRQPTQQPPAARRGHEAHGRPPGDDVAATPYDDASE